MKKGFTLIELLAVIVILAIIAVIAVPIVLNIIDETKENANKRSAEMYSKAINNSLATKMLSGKKIENGSYLITNDGNVCLGEYSENTCTGETLEINVTGTKPTTGWIAIDEGNVVYTNLTIDNKDYSSIPYTDKSSFEEVDEYRSWDIIYEFSDGTLAEYEGQKRAIIDEDKCIEVFNQYDFSNAVYTLEHVCKNKKFRLAFSDNIYSSGFAESIGYTGNIEDDGIYLGYETAKIKEVFHFELKNNYTEKIIVVPKYIDNKFVNFKTPLLAKAPNKYLDLYRKNFGEEKIIINNNSLSYKKGFDIDAHYNWGIASFNKSILPESLIAELNQYVTELKKNNIEDDYCYFLMESNNQDLFQPVFKKYADYLDPIIDALYSYDEFYYLYLSEENLNECIMGLCFYSTENGYYYSVQNNGP